mmetsp:Transcript_4122/g.8780  ORF Transcript_4122/g.8780 Transcript_4122/m.8780 type:complete len:240 (+) Transcript_4122:163-882(+)|eukprot:CAMPEP_0178504962 /NCGR_PEP_ID=MMETSP0696-20121128/18872_1 /TAXON_ID=265572 /ORGANISM="Extubocellulus spinifer, Strain CCMP396" /LENGTH=239 /DNA_ID=CAMNT_0020134231 /DNA_START=50 /DNA_END=769 /DNA_ORIENTATION=+
MSKLSEYSKFDHIDEEEEDSSVDGNAVAAASSSGCGKSSSSASPTRRSDNDAARAGHSASTSSTCTQQQQRQPSRTAMTKKGEDGRYVFECDGRKVYEWEQNLEEVNMYIDAPPGIHANQIQCNIQPNRIQIGLRGSDRFFIDESTFSKVKTADSSWYLDDSGTINVVLAKVYRGETWESALLGRDEFRKVVDPATKVQIQKDLMLERFQEENPGFDFRDAEFNGSVPDARTFMGGIGS